MKSYKDPYYQDRAGRAAEAKQRALDNLRSKAPVDEKIMAERRAARLKREAAEAEKRAARKSAEAATKAAKAAAAEAARDAAPEAAAAPAPRTEAEMKLARDARYAARKNRK